MPYETIGSVHWQRRSLGFDENGFVVFQGFVVNIEFENPAQQGVRIITSLTQLAERDVELLGLARTHSDAPRIQCGRIHIGNHANRVR